AGITTAEVNSGIESLALTLTPPGTPTVLASAASYLKADAITGLVDTDPVAAWDDSSTNNRDATEGTSSKRPQYRTNRVNGKPALLFDGSEDALDAGTYVVSHYFAVLKATHSTWNNWASILDKKMAAGSSARMGPLANGTQQFNPDPAARAVVKNGVALSSPVFNMTTINQWMVLEVKTNNPTLSRDMLIASLEDTYHLAFELAELITFSTDRTDTEASYIRQHLGDKYAITVSNGAYESYASEALGPKTAAVGGSSYSFWGSVKGTVAAGTFTYAVKWYDKNHSLISTSTVFSVTPSTSGFVEGKNQLAAPAGAAYFVESAKFEHTGAGTVYFDTIDPKKAIDGKDLHPTLDFTGEMNFKGTSDAIKLWDQDTDQKWIGIIKGLGTHGGGTRAVQIRGADFDDAGSGVPVEIISDAHARITAGTTVEITSTSGTNISGGLKVGGVAGLSVTVPLAKLTSAGNNGQLVFTNGVLTGRTDPT
ncbi:MAG TPA: hypothetical protein VEY08_11235, partial [Chloroflexia bacterium]|nr:hypothetical protein [Chloroflexia bacterium]